jgi:hypothetical protein
VGNEAQRGSRIVGGAEKGVYFRVDVVCEESKVLEMEMVETRVAKDPECQRVSAYLTRCSNFDQGPYSTAKGYPKTIQNMLCSPGDSKIVREEFSHRRGREPSR